MDLGALPPQETTCSNAYQVNANGEIVGFSENGKFDEFVGFNQSPAVRCKDGHSCARYFAVRASSLRSISLISGFDMKFFQTRPVL